MAHKKAHIYDMIPLMLKVEYSAKWSAFSDFNAFRIFHCKHAGLYYSYQLVFWRHLGLGIGEI